MFHEPQDVGVLFFGVPLKLTREHITSINVPEELPEWQEDYIYPAGALVRRKGKSYLSTLTEANSYKRDCPTLYNHDIDPSDVPIPYVPFDNPDLPLQDRCMYAEAGKAWWVEVNPDLTYGEAALNYNEYSKVKVNGAITLTIAPPDEWDMIGLFGLEATSATLTVGGDSDTRDLFLFDTPGAQPYGPLVQYSNRTVWILAEPTVSSFSLSIAPLNGQAALGNLVVALKHDFGVTEYYSTIGIRDYSRKGYDDLGYARLIPRWYQDLVRFKVRVDAEDRFKIRQVLLENRNQPNLYVGHDNPKKYELQLFGTISDISLPLNNPVYSYLDMEVESVGVPKLVYGVPGEVIPEPPPLPDYRIYGPWLAIGHDKEPYITIVNTLTWQKEVVNFEIPGPARAVLFSIDQTMLFIGHECPPYLTVVETDNWTAIDLNGPASDSMLLFPGSDSDTNDSEHYANLYDLGIVHGLAQSPDGAQLAIAHQCPPYLTVVRVGTWNRLNSGMYQLPTSLLRVGFTRDSRYLLAADSCHRRGWFDISDYSTLNVLPDRGVPFLFTKNGLYLILGYDIAREMTSESYSDLTPSSEQEIGPRIEVYRMTDLATPILVSVLPGDPYTIKESPDGKYVVVGHRCAPYVTVFDATTGQEIETYFELEYGVCALEFSGDGLYLAVVYRHEPYCTFIRVGSWRIFNLSYLELSGEASSS